MTPTRRTTNRPKSHSPTQPYRVTDVLSDTHLKPTPALCSKMPWPTYEDDASNVLYVLIASAPDQEIQGHPKLPYKEAFLTARPIQNCLVKTGIRPSVVKAMAEDMGWDQGDLINLLGLARSTVSRKIKVNEKLSVSDSERVLGAIRLVGLVQQIVEESGDPEGFDATAWVGQWLEQPLPALGGAKPSEYMDTNIGQDLIAQLLRQAQAGTYA